MLQCTTLLRWLLLCFHGDLDVTPRSISIGGYHITLSRGAIFALNFVYFAIVVPMNEALNNEK